MHARNVLGTEQLRAGRSRGDNQRAWRAWAENVRARAVLEIKKCARVRSRGKKMHARMVIEPKQCVRGASSGRKSARAMRSQRE